MKKKNSFDEKMVLTIKEFIPKGIVMKAIAYRDSIKRETTIQNVCTKSINNFLSSPQGRQNHYIITDNIIDAIKDIIEKRLLVS